MEEVRDVSPTTAGTISQRRWLSVSATTAIMFVALSLAVAGGTTDGLDRAVHRWLHDSGVGHGGWLMSMQAATHLGDIGTVVTVEIAAAVTCVVTQRLRTATLIATTAGLVWALRIGVRDIIDRPRPIDAF